MSCFARSCGPPWQQAVQLLNLLQVPQPVLRLLQPQVVGRQGGRLQDLSLEELADERDVVEGELAHEQHLQGLAASQVVEQRLEAPQVDGVLGEAAATEDAQGD